MASYGRVKEKSPDDKEEGAGKEKGPSNQKGRNSLYR
jgi:hypothetical protein